VAEQIKYSDVHHNSIVHVLLLFSLTASTDGEPLEEISIAKLHDCITHYGKRPFMVSCKIELHRNVLELLLARASRAITTTYYRIF